MKKLLSVLLAAALTIAPIKALAQQFPTVPSGTVIGRTQAGTGPAQAIPFATLIATMLASSPTIPTLNTTTVIYQGTTSGQATVSAQAVAGTPTIKWPNTSGTVATNATAPIVLNGTTGNISCPTCVVGILQSRAAAIALDLSSYSAVRTLGYASAGDGGSATFQKVTSLTDVQIATATITSGGSGYTNGSYTGVTLIGGNGFNAIGSATVSGGAVTAVSLNVPSTDTAYRVGDVLGVASCAAGSPAAGVGCIGAGSGFQWTINTVTAPRGSFIDAAGNRWQIVPGEEGDNNIRQFGAKCDWAGTDGTATDDTTSIQSASNWTAIISPPGADLGGALGGVLRWPNRTCMTTALITIPYGTFWVGQGPQQTFLKANNSFSVATNIVNICDPSTHLSCFNAGMKDMGLYAKDIINANSNTAAVYSNNIQHAYALNNVKIYAGNRVAGFFELGYGGASWLGVRDSESFSFGGCNGAATGNPQWIFSNFGTTTIRVEGLVVQGPSTCTTGSPAFGMLLGNGIFHVEDVHVEGRLSQGISITTGAGFGGRLHGITGGVGTGSAVNLATSNANGNMVLGNIFKNGSTVTVSNGHSGGSNVTTDIIIDTIYSP